MVEENLLVPYYRSFIKTKSIIINYVVFYIYEKNGIAKSYLRILVIKKDLLLINSSLPFYF